MKETDGAIIFRSRDFKKAVYPCRQELQTSNFDLSRFRGTNSINSTLKDNHDVIIVRSHDLGKIL